MPTVHAGRGQILIGEIPIDEMAEECGDIVETPVLIVQ